MTLTEMFKRRGHQWELGGGTILRAVRTVAYAPSLACKRISLTIAIHAFCVPCFSANIFTHGAYLQQKTSEP